LETPGETRRKPRHPFCRRPRRLPGASLTAEARSPQAWRSRVFGLTVAAGAKARWRRSMATGDPLRHPAGAQGEQCALIQSVVAEDRSNAGLTVIVLKTADQKSKLMRCGALGCCCLRGSASKLDNQDVGPPVLSDACQWLRRRGGEGRQAARQLRTARPRRFIISETPEEGSVSVELERHRRRV